MNCFVFELQNILMGEKVLFDLKIASDWEYKATLSELFQNQKFYSPNT